MPHARFSEHTNAHLAREVEWNVNPATMLRLDFAARPRRGHAMDDDTSELIAHLCTRVGMIMEDASVEALTIGQLAPGRQADAIRELEKASARIAALLGAAKALQS